MTLQHGAMETHFDDPYGYVQHLPAADVETFRPFRDWVSGRDQGEVYTYTSPYDCAITRFLLSTLEDAVDARVGPYDATVYFGDGTSREIFLPRDIGEAVHDSYTMGQVAAALAHRHDAG